MVAKNEIIIIYSDMATREYKEIFYKIGKNKNETSKHSF